MPTYIHTHLCAVYVNGCESRILMESNSPAVDEKFLRLNGWKLNHGRWVCDKHGVEIETDSEGRTLR